MSVTHKQHSSLMYNLTLDSRETGDIKSISREQMKRNSFARDQGLAAHAAGMDKTELLRQASRAGAKIRNLHANMGNTSATGGCGGLGYATARDGAVTADPTYLPDGEVLKCFVEMGKISVAKNYILVNQTICKPNACIYARFAMELGATPINNPERLTDIDRMTITSTTETETTFDVHITNGYFDTTFFDDAGDEGEDDILTIPIVFDADTTYWFVRLFNKTTKEHELIYVNYADRPMGRFPGAATVNNYPNMPLSGTKDFSQSHYDTYKGTVEKYPSTAERDAYTAANQAELDSIATQTAEQQAFIESLQPQYDVHFLLIQGATEEQQTAVLDDYLDNVKPAVEVLALDPHTFTQIELDDWAILVLTDTVLYEQEAQALEDIRISQDKIAAVDPTVASIDLYHSFADALPLTVQEEAALDTISALQLRKSEILFNAPQSDLIHNANYSEWGDETFMHHYPKYYDQLWESFLSKGFTHHKAVNRFLSMVGQRPRAFSDAIRGGLQTEAAEGDIATMCDQLTFGCQITDTADYAEMRYAIEFAKSAWWATMWDNENYVGSRPYAEDIFSEYGRSAWSTQHIEETMLSPGNDTMKSIRTRWGVCEVWIEEGGEVDNGQFGALSMDQTSDKSDWFSPVDEHPTNSDWDGKGSLSQTIVGTYNIAAGYVLKIRMEGITTFAYSEQKGGNWNSSTSTEFPIIPLFSNVLKAIPVMQICQMQNEFIFIRTQIGWKQKKSNWVNFRDTKLLKIIGIVISVIGIVLAIPSGGATLSWTAVGTALMWAAVYYVAVRVIAHYVQQWGLDKTWIGAALLAIIAVVAIYMGLPPTESALLATTVTADSLAKAYMEVNLAEARAAAGKMEKLDDALDELYEDILDLEEQQDWLDFYSATDLVKMREDAVNYVRNETPDKYFERMLGYQSNMLDLGSVDYAYDYSLNIELP